MYSVGFRLHVVLTHCRQVRAKEPGFPIGITERTFVIVQEWLHKIAYEGPFHIGVDDTKLSPALRPYYDKERKMDVLLGTPGEPPALPSPDALARVIERAQYEKATQVKSSSHAV